MKAKHFTLSFFNTDIVIGDLVISENINNGLLNFKFKPI